MKKLTNAVHVAGAKIGLQLWQGGFAVASDLKAQIILPDQMTIQGTESIIPATNCEVLQEIVVAFGEAARRAVEAGFDCVEFHCAHNYSPHSFLSPAFNHREDNYGGSFFTDAVKYEVPPIDLPRGFNVENAAKIKKETGMLTVAVGRINDPAQVEEILAEKKADFVVIGRGQLADPEFCNKSLEGREDEIVKCVACNQGCYDGFVDPSFPHWDSVSCDRGCIKGS